MCRVLCRINVKQNLYLFLISKTFLIAQNNVIFHVTILEATYILRLLKSSIASIKDNQDFVRVYILCNFNNIPCDFSQCYLNPLTLLIMHKEKQ